MLAKTFSAPTRSMSMQCLSSTSESFLSQKIDLIAELKASKDITGIKKMKVEQARLEDRDAYADMARQFTATHFVDQVCVGAESCWGGGGVGFLCSLSND